MLVFINKLLNLKQNMNRIKRVFAPTLCKMKLPWLGGIGGIGAKPPLGVETTRGNPAGIPILRAIPLPAELIVQLCCRKSSSISSTLANRLLDDRSFISISFCFALYLSWFCSLRFILSPGRLIISHLGRISRNNVRTYSPISKWYTNQMSR